MTHHSQAEKAAAFGALHRKGDPVILYNIWDAGGADALARAGAAAIATGSHSVAEAQGYGDGEQIPMEFALQIAARIVDTVELPVTIDFEGGYATDPEPLAQNVEQLIATGAVGLNFEDQIVGAQGLHPIQTQALRIAAIRQAADTASIPLFINARTDVFLKSAPESHAEHLGAALERAAAYAEAGASGIFVPGLTDLDLIARITESTTLPVNVLVTDSQGLSNLAKAGVSRISFGPFPYREAMARIGALFAAI